MNFKTVQEAQAYNQSLPCSLEDCFRNRNGLAKYCEKHKLKAITWGHPKAGAVLLRDYAVERGEVKEIIKNNPDHKGIRNQIRYLEDLLGNSYRGHSKFDPHLVHLFRKGVTGEELFIHVAGIYLKHWRGSRKIKSDRHLTYLIGHHILKRRYGKGNIPGPLKRELGELIEKQMGLLLTNIARTLGRKEGERNRDLMEQNAALIKK
jgi:hypothetical protein